MGQLSVFATNVYNLFSKFATIALLSLMPLYLFFIYIKLDNTDAMSYALVMAVIFILYLPIQILASEKDIPISFHMIYEDEDVLKIVANTLLFLFSIIIMKFYFDIGLTILYISWLILQFQIFNIFKLSNIFNKMKMLFVFIAILIAVSFKFFSVFSDFTFAFDIETVILISYVFLQFLFGLAVLFPFFAFVIFSKVIATITSKHSFFNLEEISIGTLLFLIAGLFISYVLLIHFINSFLNSINPYEVAFYSVYGFITVSTIGAYFQFKLFWSYFLDEKKSWLATLASLCVFIGILLILVNTQELVEKREQLIVQSQQDFDGFYQKHRN